MPASVIEQGRQFARYTRGLRAFLAEELTEDECRAQLEQRLDRGAAFVALLRDCVFGAAPSPYRALFDRAGLGLADVARLVGRDGLEDALQHLFEAGIYVTLDELRGRRPIERPGLRLDVRADDFVNPLMVPVYESRSGGSRSAGGRVTPLHFASIDEQILLKPFVNRALGIVGRPYALWRPVPPGVAGLIDALSRVKLRSRTDRWFSQSPVAMGRTSLRHDMVLRATVLASRRLPAPIPWPVHVPVGRAAEIAVWLGSEVAAGRAPVLNSPASAAVRICLAARDNGVDISGTFFRVASEPVTAAKVAVIRSVGADAASTYASSETGVAGVACSGAPRADDVHLRTDKLAVIQQPTPQVVHQDALLFTTLQPTCTRVLINAESDDSGVVERRPCGCPLGELGLDTHITRIRSHEKVTIEGMSLLRTDVVELLETALPARFGGDATDYQLVEDDRGSLRSLELAVSVRVGPIDEDAAVDALLRGLGDGGLAQTMMARIWRDGRTVRVVRRDPYVSAAGKMNSVHVLR